MEKVRDPIVGNSLNTKKKPNRAKFKKIQPHMLSWARLGISVLQALVPGVMIV